MFDVNVVEGWKLTQAGAAKRLSAVQLRMDDLLCGLIDKFSLDVLMMLAMEAGRLCSRIADRKVGWLDRKGRLESQKQM